MRRRRLLDAMVVAALAGEGRALAQPASGTAKLQWVMESPSDCISREAFEKRTESEAGRPVFVTGPASVTLVVTLSRVYDPDGWHASVKATSADGRVIGTRDLTNAGNSCALGDKLAILVAMMLDPSLGAPAVAPKPTPEPAPEPDGSKPEPRPVLPVDEEPVYLAPSLQLRKPAPTLWQLDAHAIGALGVLPAFAGGVELSALVAPSGFWAIRASATWFADQTETVEGGRARFRTLYGGLSLCPVADLRARTWSQVCAGFDVGPFWVKSQGLHPSRELSTAVFQGALTAAVGLQLSHNGYVGALLAATIPLVSERFVVDLPDGSRRTVFDMSGMTLALGVGGGLLWN